MKFEKLRIRGFKTFVEPTEFLIEPGLTGVIGPNGCGKSNLVEAMRWVMGENSYKNMRASGMDDVIFSGSGKRPARNTADVTLVLRNTDRTAPAAFNDAEVLEISRRIERESGSNYRINGKDVRARDVQLLFADASTGARSPAMVRQGQIGELIAAKPTARRAILEEAAGISGLHSRRHEAEMRLKAAETNLTRLDDVVTEIEARLETLRKQARQAARYRALSAEIRKAEATSAWLRWSETDTAAMDAERAVTDGLSHAAERQAAQAETARLQAIAAHRLPALRDESVRAAAARQRLSQALADSEAEERRVRARIADLTRRAGEILRDRDREAALVADNDARLAALVAEAEDLAAAAEEDGALQEEAAARRAEAEDAAAGLEARLSEATRAHAEAVARRDALARERRDAVDRMARLQRDLAALDGDLAAIRARLDGESEIAEARDEAEIAAEQLVEAEVMAETADAAAAEAEAAERAARAPLADAEKHQNRLDTEARTLAKVLNLEIGALFPPLVDQLTAAAGYELALGAALGDDIEASIDTAAPAHWADPGPADGDPPLPDGAAPLSRFVKGPALVQRRLAQIGVVDRRDGPRLRLLLAPGQRLISQEGDLWRWDGYVAVAGAPTPAAQRLASRNRLAELDAQRAAAAAVVAEHRKTLADAQGAARAAADTARAAREAVRAANRALADARDRLARAERALSDVVARRSALEGQRQRLVADLDEARGRAEEAAAAEAELDDPDALAAAVQAARLEAAEARAVLAEARSAAEALAREREIRARRQQAIAAERDGWSTRVANARSQLDELAARLDEVETERAELMDRPDEIVAGRHQLLRAIAEAETAAKAAADRLAAGEAEEAEASRRAAEALKALSESREGRARAEERFEGLKARRLELAAEIRDRFECPPFALKTLAEIKDGAPAPDVTGIDARLERLRQERERLGGVNLQAETEVAEVEARLDTIIHEREDLIEAIRRLRQGIQSLNREARERLLAAFDLVNGHFQRLFSHLFGGGDASLKLVDSDDPLDAGLEIFARPPGKKPSTMTLLSGGEQALTATALIFAVFLTNPAPICVLDEVDAPLDDANVERYCDLLDEMARSTDTRFIVITHNPITMARMNRLFGVTMVERGVSQLVSVDLETAEAIREAV
ncbi:chromosome segregation SMC family protein [Chthonobacter rhizosphaerae]|uniref:chromosome segregation SMC family protein n=1 Tax=Chthonobacter rhizosphaerae TaxID=2735553 RepID=UPI0015EF0DD4|nr:chromosome segregation SMC family protein [Chthonobacter rhizosphaerae]